VAPDHLAHAVDRESSIGEPQDLGVRVGDVARDAFGIDHAERALRCQAEVGEQARSAFDRGRGHRRGARSRRIGDRLRPGDRVEGGVRDEPLDGEPGGHRELSGVAGVGHRGRCIIVIAGECGQREQGVDASADQAGGRGLASGRVAAARALPRSPRASSRRATITSADASSIVRCERSASTAVSRASSSASWTSPAASATLCAGELAVEVVAGLGARILRELDGTGALTTLGTRARKHHRDVRGRGRIERRLTVELLEARSAASSRSSRRSIAATTALPRAAR